MKVLSKKRVALVIGFVAMGSFCIALLFEDARWWMYGVARFESFYQGKPTSYWSQRLAAAEQFGRGYGFRVNQPSLPEWLASFRSVFGPRPLDPTTDPLVPKGDPAALPVQMELLRAPEPCVRFHAVLMLGQMGPQACAAAPALERMLHDPEGLLRAASAHALWKVDPRQAETCLATLLEALEHEDWMVRNHAAASVGEMGPLAKVAVPKLLKLVEARDEEMARLNTSSIAAQDVPPAIPTQRKQMRDQPNTIQPGTNAIGALQSIDPEALARNREAWKKKRWTKEPVSCPQPGP